MQVLGLGWDFIRGKAVMMMGEKTVNALETGYDVFKNFATKGIEGIWEFLKDKFTDLKETVIESIKSMLITQVIEAGVKWLFSLLIPGAGFIKAIMAIKDIIVFFVESAMMLIPAITDAILSLAAGSIAGVAIAIERGLGLLIPLVINLFAKLIGLGGLAKKVMKIFEKIRGRVSKIVNKLLKKAKKFVRKLFGKKGRVNERPTNQKDHDIQVKAGLRYLHQQEKVLDRDNNHALTPKEAQKVASLTKKKFKVFTSITPKDVSGKWTYHWTGSQDTELSSSRVEHSQTKVFVKNEESLGKGVKFEIIDEKGNFIGIISKNVMSGGAHNGVRYFFKPDTSIGKLIKNKQYDLNCLVKIISKNSKIKITHVGDLLMEDGENMLYGDFNIPIQINSLYRGMGKIIFDDAIETLKNSKKSPIIDGVFGVWIEGEKLYEDFGGKSLNLKKFWNAAENMDYEEAAFETITGEWLKQQGYTKVKIQQADDKAVVVKFYK